MTVEDMHSHYHQILIKMADTYERATNNKDAAGMIRNFGDDFSKMLQLKNDKLHG
jgi:hypothetical protein